MIMYAEVEEIVTGDGSKTLYDKVLDVTYRSRFGALAESEYVFIKGTRLPELILAKRSAPQKHSSDNIKILELGFGAATNFFTTTALYVSLIGDSRANPLEYLSLDSRPLHPDILPNTSQFSPLVHEALLGVQKHGIYSVTHPEFPITLTLLYYPWSHPAAIEYTQGYDADCYFHDPFGPRTNPDSWDETAFRWAFDRIRSKGILATYSAASHVKRHIRSVGFSLEVRKGIPPKREVLAATKP